LLRGADAAALVGRAVQQGALVFVLARLREAPDYLGA
jgi:hypothetical protein